tara:strand:+ start:509 stop:1147 length:639 start_codon:yes stop_codon:yes gene_type:complete
MKIKTFQGGYDDNLSYVISCNRTNKCAIVDASVSSVSIIEYIESHNLFVDKILITHSHNDHINFINEYTHYFPNALTFGHAINKGSYLTNKLENNQLITIGKEHLIAIYTPGHYLDSICYYDYNSKTLFSGDTIFVGRTGRVNSKGSNIRDLYNSVYRVIFKLPHDTIIYPGHHYGHKRSISIKENIRISNFFQCNSFKEFLNVMQNFEKSR